MKTNKTIEALPSESEFDYEIISGDKFFVIPTDNKQAKQLFEFFKLSDLKTSIGAVKPQ